MLLSIELWTVAAYGCGGLQQVKTYLNRDDVKKALHIKDQGSHFAYDTSGPASITLWPFLAKHIRVLIYNGDVDAWSADDAQTLLKPLATHFSPDCMPITALLHFVSLQRPV